jgi:hypothetical protein
MSWQALAEAAPELAALGAERLHGSVAYLAASVADTCWGAGLVVVVSAFAGSR